MLSGSIAFLIARITLIASPCSAIKKSNLPQPIPCSPEKRLEGRLTQPPKPSRRWSTVNRSTRYREPSPPPSRIFEFCSDQTFQVGVIQRITRGGKAHREDMAGTERLKPPAMFVPIKEGFQRKSDQSQKESR